MVHNKKGQGALEFLMTYGWAFLVILIMIGALAYFGVLNPTKFLPERCIFGAQMPCKDYLMDSTATTITLRLQNGFGYNIGVKPSSTVESPDGLACASVAYTDTSSVTLPIIDISNYQVDEGQTFVATYSGCTFTQSEGSKEKAEIELQYYDTRSGPSFTHTVSGELFATVE